MGWFQRKANSPVLPEPEDPVATGDLGTILLQGQDMIDQLGRAHDRAWGLGSAQTWSVDQELGTITWVFADRTATAPVQMIGSRREEGAGEWMWAWANESLMESMRRDAEKVRRWGMEHDHAALTSARFPADEETAATLAAVACRISRAKGYYRSGTGGTLQVFLTFGAVDIVAADGTSSKFNLDLGD